MKKKQKKVFGGPQTVFVGLLIGFLLAVTFVTLTHGWETIRDYNWSRAWNSHCDLYHCRD